MQRLCIVTFFVVVGLVIITECHHLQKRVVDGNDATHGQIPYQASIRVKENNIHFCGGSIISTRFILTAAHCTTKELTSKADNIIAVVGTIYLSSGGQVLDIAKIINHKNYMHVDRLNDRANDIALLLVKGEIHFNEFVQPVALEDADTYSFSMKRATFCGWGTSASAQRSNVLQCMEGTAYNDTDCERHLDSMAVRLRWTDICYDSNDLAHLSFACTGDSGGPLVNKISGKQIGIASQAPKNCDGPTLFASVPGLYLWIQKQRGLATKGMSIGQMSSVEIDSGRWDKDYDVQFPFFRDGSQLIYMESKSRSIWSGLHLTWQFKDIYHNGKMGPTSNGPGSDEWEGIFSFVIEGKTFIFYRDTHSGSKKYRVIYQHLPVSILYEGEMDKRYDVFFSFAIDGKHYLYAYINDGHEWIIQELDSETGLLGTITDRGQWESDYKGNFPFSIAGRQYFYACAGKQWFMRELLPDGKMGSQTDNGVYASGFNVQFPFSIEGRQFFFMNNNVDNSKSWFIYELLPYGRMGGMTDTAKWEHSFDIQFPFSINGIQYFYAYSKDQYRWFIGKLY